MDIPKKRLWLVCVLLFAAGLIFLPAPNSSAADDKVVLVGRISFVEGQILRYVPENKDWVATVKDAPFGMDDALYSDQAGRAEFIMPNGIWVRIGGSTQVQLIAMNDDAGEMDVASGVARFYNRSSDAVLKVTTPFGYVLADPGSSFDLYVGDQSVEVLALSGQVDFINPGNAKYDVAPGSGSIIADARQTAAGEGTVDAEWDDWNASRNSLWTKRQVKGQSANYLPPQLQDDAYDLEENGKWEKVYYEGEYRNYWAPTRVEPSWQPFSAGRWTEYYGDQCWVPAEPFGYVTHHYGNWVVVNGRWFWAPPAPRVVAAGPAVSFGWYPGRVAWISSGADVGWVPLAPAEPYYARRHWGPQAIIVAPTAVVPVVNVGRLAFVDRAVIVPQAQLYSVNTYSTHITRVEKTVIINNYRGAPDVQRAVPNYGQFQQRHNFATGVVAQKPHNEVIQRINHNQQVATRESKTFNAQSVRQGATAAKQGQPVAAQPGLVQPPKLTNKIVPANQVATPKNQVTFKPTAMKTNTKPPATPPAGMLGPRGGTTAVKPAGAQQTTTPGVSTQPGTPPTRPGQQQPGTPPTKPGQQQPGVSTQPTTPGRALTPGTQPGATTQPSTTGRPVPPGTRPGAAGTPTTQPGLSTQPVTPGRALTPGTQPGATTQPSTPGRTMAPGTRQRGQEVQPTRPGASTQPTTPGARQGGSEIQQQPGTRGTITPGGTTSPQAPSRGGPAATSPGQSGRQLRDRPVSTPATTAPPVRQSPSAVQNQRPQTQSVQPQAQPQRQQQVQPQVQPQRQVQPQAQPQRQVQPQAQPQRQQQVQPQQQRQAPAATQPGQQQQKKKPGEPGYQP